MKQILLRVNLFRLWYVAFNERVKASNVFDVMLMQVLSGVALVSFRASRVPKDKEHPYGHF